MFNDGHSGESFYPGSVGKRGVSDVQRGKEVVANNDIVVSVSKRFKEYIIPN